MGPGISTAHVRGFGGPLASPPEQISWLLKFLSDSEHFCYAKAIISLIYCESRRRELKILMDIMVKSTAAFVHISCVRVSELFQVYSDPSQVVSRPNIWLELNTYNWLWALAQRVNKNPHVSSGSKLLPTQRKFVSAWVYNFVFAVFLVFL